MTSSRTDPDRTAEPGSTRVASGTVRASSTRVTPEGGSERRRRTSPLAWLPWAVLGLLAGLLALVLLVINAVDDDGPGGPAGDQVGQLNSGGSGIDGQDGNGRIAGTEGGQSGSSGSSGDPGTGTGSGSAGSTGSSGSAESSGSSGGSGGTSAAPLRVGDQDLLPLSGGSLTDRLDQQVAGSARVQSVVSDEGFWVGAGERERVFVHLTPQARQADGESPFRVRAGQTVELTGRLVSVQSAPAPLRDVTRSEGLEQARSQGAYVSADSVRLAG